MAILSPTTVSVPDDGSPIGSSNWNNTVGLIKKRLTSDTTFYLRTDGNDSNDGTTNTSGGAWLTPQGAFDYICRYYDLQGYYLTVQVADGTYTVANSHLLNIAYNWAGGGAIKFLGNASDRTAVKFQTTGSGAALTSWAGNASSGVMGGDFYITKIQLLGAQYGCAHNSVGNIFIDSCDVTGTVAHFTTILNGHIFISGTYAILGNSQYHVYANDSSYMQYAPTAVSTSSSRAFSVAFVGCLLNSFIDYAPVTVSGSGVTGKKYITDKNATLNAIGYALSAFPGDSTGTNQFGILQTSSGNLKMGIPNGMGFHDDAENEQLLFTKTASAVNYLTITNSTAAAAPAISAAGDDAAIDLALIPKSTGVVKFGVFASTASEVVTGYITIRDAAGTLRKLAVIE
jgi:hypothetical protein